MPDALVFPYSITLQQDGRIATTPTADVFFKTQSGKYTSLIMQIDSGATISAMPAGDAHVFGVEYRRGTRIDIRGVGAGSVVGWVHIMKVRVGQSSEAIDIPLAFLERDDAPYILGRAGIFDVFTVIFEEYKHRSALLLKSKKTAQSVARLLG